MRRPNRRALLVVAVAACGFLAIWSHVLGLTLFAVAVVALIGTLLYERLEPRHRERAWIERARRDAIVLRSPFEAAWRVVSGGPAPAHNPNFTSSDRRFEYTFTPVAGESGAQHVVAPCSGMIVHTETGAHSHDAYVTIERKPGFVLVGGLDSRYLLVKSGDLVTAGDPIGRCSETARVTVYAQDALRVNETAVGIPVAFRTPDDEALILEFGDIVASMR